jgi:hypothetical protein
MPAVGDDILAAIDAAVGCQHCGGPLGDSPSDDFCSAAHQQAWHAARADELIGYREPWDRPWDFPGAGTDEYQPRAGRGLHLGRLRADDVFVADRGGEWVALSTAASFGAEPDGGVIGSTYVGAIRVNSMFVGSVRVSWPEMEFRLPPETADLARDREMARRAAAVATTDAQRAAVRLRMESLAQRQAEYHRQAMAALLPTIEDMSERLRQFGELLAVGLRALTDGFAKYIDGFRQAGMVSEQPPDDPMAPRRNRNTGPAHGPQRPPRRIDARGARR